MSELVDGQELKTLFNVIKDGPVGGDKNLLVEKVKSFLPRLVNTYLADKTWGTVAPAAVTSGLELLHALSVKIPQAFTYETSSVCSVLFKVIPLMSEPNFRDSQGILQKTICSLLQLLYGYDISACKFFFQDSTVLLQDLLEILQTLYTKNEKLGELFGEPFATYEESVYVQGYCSLAQHNYFLKKSDNAKKAGGTEEPLTDDSDVMDVGSGDVQGIDVIMLDVSNVWRCTSAQVCVTKILAQIIQTDFVFKDIAILWYLVHTQIQHGQPLLKHAALCLLNSLLDNYDLPATNVIDPIVSCLLGLLSSDLPQQYLSHFRNPEIDEAMGVALGKLYARIPQATIKAFSSQLTSALHSTLQYNTSSSLKISLCKAFHVTLTVCPTVAPYVSLLIPFFDYEPIQTHVVEICNYAISILHGDESGQHKGKRRRLNLDQPQGADAKYGEQLLQDILDVIERLKVSNYKDNPQKLISGAVTLDTALQICLANDGTPLETAATILSEWIQQIHSDVQKTVDHSYFRVVNILGSLIGKILISGPTSFSDPLITTFFPLLSLPWSKVPLFYSKDAQDKPNTNTPASTALTVSSTSVSPPAPPVTAKDVVVTCLEALAWLPPAAFVSERKKFFLYALRSGDASGNKLLQEEQVRVQAVCNLPLFLARIGPEHVYEFVSTVSDLIAVEKSPLVLEAIARFAGFLVCLSDHESPIWKSHDGHDSNFFKSDIHSIEPPGFEVLDKTELKNTVLWFPKCHICDRTRFSHTENVKVTHSQSSFNTWQAFLGLAAVELPSEVRAAFIFGTFLRILRHCAPYSQVDVDNFWEVSLKLVNDKEFDVRVAVARAIATFAASDQRKPVCEGMLLRIRNAFIDASIDPNILKTAYILYGELACVLEGEYMLVAFLSLLEGFANIELRPFVHDQIRYFTKKIGTTPKDLMKQFASSIYHALMIKIETSFAVIEEVCVMLDYPDVRTGFFADALPHALPLLVVQHNDRVLDEIAKRTKKEVAFWCITYATEILIHLLMETEQDRLANQIVHLCELTGCSHRHLIEAGLNDLLYQLVTKLGNPELQQKASVALRSMYRMLKTDDSTNTNEAFAEFIFVNFLSLADKISDVLGQKTGDPKHPNTPEQKENVLRSLGALLEILGPHHLNSVRPKVMAILKSVIQRYPQLHYHACSVWLTFVQRLDVSHLGPILSQIFVDLLPCVGGKGSEKAVAVFQYLVVKHRQELKGFFKEIPFLPDQEGPLREIAALVLAEQSSGVKAQITQILHTLQHESTDVRKMALTKLKEVLKVHRNDVNTLILSDIVDPVIHRLVKALLVGSRDAHHSLRLPYAECIGELGAIDPGRLGVMDLRPDDTWVEKDEMGMAAELILFYLVKALNAASNATSQDRAAFAIQEVLKFAGCSNKVLSPNAKGKGKDFWNNLPEEKREIVKPYLNSKYILSTASNSSSNLNQTTSTTAQTIYHANMPYTKWISAWTSSLLPKAQGPKLQIFLACRGVVKDDTRTAHYLLPYLLLHVLLNGGEEDRTGVLGEMLAVLNDCVGVAGTSPAKAGGPTSESAQLSTQKVFHLIDLLNNWVEAEIAAEDRQSKMTPSSRAAPKKRSATGYQKIQNMLAEIPTILLATAAYKCKSFARALLYLEKYLRAEMASEKKDKAKAGKSDIVQQHLGFLQKIYSGLDEPDGLEGCAAIRINTSLDERITDHEHAGHWSEALACYDMALQALPQHIPYRIGILTCLRNLGHFDTMASLVQGSLASANNNKHVITRLTSVGVQAAWRLSNWSLLDEFVSKIPDAHPTDFEASVGKILVLMRGMSTQVNANANTQPLAQALAQSRVDLMASLGAASMESYHKSYPIIAKLHLLHELEQSSKLSQTVPAEFLADWELRLKITQPSFKISEPILSFRRLIFSMHNAGEEVSRTWLQIGKSARISNQLQTATNAVMKARLTHMSGPLLSHLESAKLLHKMGNTRQALNELQDELRRAKGITPVDNMDKMLLAKTHILVGKWMKETGQIHHAEIIDHYNQSIKHYPSMEKGHFYLASYYDTFVTNILNQIAPSSQRNKQNYIPRVSLKPYISYARSALRAFGSALKNGHTFLFQSLPRLLTIWFEFGSHFNPSNMNHYSAEMDAIYGAKKKKPIAEKLAKIYTIVKELRDSLPAYLWFTSFPQLTSRICHKTNEVWEILRGIICKVLVTYPQQGLWTMVALSKSNVDLRQSRANEVLRKTSETSDAMAKLQDELMILVDKLVWLSNENIPKNVKNLSLEVEYQKRMHKSFHAEKKDRITPILVPLKYSLTATLPTSGLTDLTYQPFANNLPTINSFRDSFEVLGSVQQPKKVTIVDSAGKDNIFLCKPEDDLRKDARMMEFNTLINKLLKKDPLSRRRNLNIRTYAVTPLNEECGLIEWVPNTATFKSILTQIYKDEGLQAMGGLKTLWEKKPSVETFVDKVLPCYPQRFHVWFEKVFRDPCSWFEARLAYCGTLAVMSMVGFVVGLGDRHGENILFDSKTGEAVHVDFNCLFWKGQTFKKPEKVPFRLTPNLVDAMGLTGYEGLFKKVCEITLGLLRANKDTVISVLHTFIYDPLVEWSKTKPPSGEYANEDAVHTIKKIERRLMGYPDDYGLPLSVEGQVYQQIQEATSPENLSQMYIGWAPWL